MERLLLHGTSKQIRKWRSLLRNFDACDVDFAFEPESALRAIFQSRITVMALEITGDGSHAMDLLALARSHEHSRRQRGIPAIGICEEIDYATKARILSGGFAAVAECGIHYDGLRAALVMALLRVREIRCGIATNCRSVDGDQILQSLMLAINEGKQSQISIRTLATWSRAIQGSGRELVRESLEAWFRTDVTVAQDATLRLASFARSLGAHALADLAATLSSALRAGDSGAIERSAVLNCAEIDRIAYSLRDYGQSSS